MVIEYCPFSLAEMFLDENASAEDVSQVYAEILAGVAYMHGAGFAHGDLKLAKLSSA